jgi:hypothetical protein
LCLGVGWEVVCSREESRKEGSNSRWLQQQNGVGEAGSYNLRSGRPPRSIFPMPAAWLSSCPPHHHHHRPVTHSMSSRLQAPPYAPLCCIKGVRFHSHANQNAANTHSRTRPPTVRATQGVEGLHTTSKSCGSHLQIESPSLLHTDGPPLSGTWVDGWMDGWRLCRVSLADNCPSWL